LFSHYSARLLLFFQWKGRNDIVYSYCIAAEELLMDRSEKSPARSSRLNKNTAPIDAPNEMLNLTQAADVNLAAKFQPAASSGGSKDVPAIEELSCLLQKAEAEAVNDLSKHDNIILDNLRTALACTRAGFMEFGVKQDSVCREYEREAHSIEEQIREHEFPVGDVGVNNDFGVNDETGLGQAASDADVHVFSSMHIYLFFVFFCLILMITSIHVCRKRPE
jgi:hypothetical protein